MATADRAKQFIPFNALKGFREALEAKEQLPVSRKELSEERLLELDAIVRRIHMDDQLHLICYHGGHYEKITGRAAEISLSGRYIKIAKRIIPFDDIYDIRFM